MSNPTSANPPAQPLLYTAEQAAELLQVSPSWLRKKASARAVPCTFIGKHLRFSASDLDAIITAGARTSAEPRARQQSLHTRSTA